MIKSSLKDYTLPQEKLTGIYRGVVEDNTDTLVAGRCKVRIFGVHSQSKVKTGSDGIPTAELPWAEPALSVAEGALTGYGFFSVPLVNSHVFVFFENGNILKPIYFAAAPGIISSTPDWSSGSAGTYPHNTVLKVHGGHYVELDSTPSNERIKVYHKTGTLTEIDKDGNIQVTGVKNETVNISQNVTRTVGGTFEDTVTGNVTEQFDANWNITVGGSATIAITGQCGITVGGSATIAVTGQCSITGNPLNLN